MFLRRQAVIKYSSLILILWIIYFFTFSSHRGDDEKLEIEQDVINRIVERAKQTENKRHEMEKLRHENQVGNDNDHPAEERQKAEEQVKKNHAKIQVDEPIIPELKSPGLNLM